jgi:hypothetical protein
LKALDLNDAVCQVIRDLTSTANTTRQIKLVVSAWFDVSHRPTRDADFLSKDPADAGELREPF